MNKKIRFELGNFDRDVFKEKMKEEMKDVKFLVGETYCIDIYNTKVDRMKRIPFTLSDTINKDKLFELLHFKICWHAPYYGRLYKGRFYICIH